MSTGSQTTGSESSVGNGISAKMPIRVGLVLFAAITIAFVAITIAFVLHLLHGRETPEQQAQRLTTTYGIRVEFGDPSTFYTPPYGPNDATAPGFEPEPADPELAGVAMHGVEAAFRKYPPGFVDGLIDAAFICGKLRMDGALAGGSAGPAWIVLSAPDDLDREHIRTLTELSSHHELSSHVLRRDPATLARWIAFAPSDAQFVKNVRETLARGELAEPDPGTGFLTAYGSTSPENDFNTYAEKVFADAETLTRMARKHDLIKRKMLFVLETYEQADSRLQQYFAESGLDSVR